VNESLVGNVTDKGLFVPKGVSMQYADHNRLKWFGVTFQAKRTARGQEGNN